MNIDDLTTDAPTLKEVMQKAKGADLQLRIHPINSEGVFKIKEVYDDYSVVEFSGASNVGGYGPCILPHAGGALYEPYNF